MNRLSKLNLKSKKLVELQELCTSFGLSKSGTKSILDDRLTQHLQHISQSKFPNSLVSIDVGCVNLGFCHLKCDYNEFKPLESPKITIKDWGVFSVDIPKEYHSYKFAVECRRILDSQLYKPDASLYIVEKQSIRPIGIKQMIPKPILRSSIFEAILLGMIVDRGTKNNVKCESINPQLISTLFDLNGAGSYHRKKSNGVTLVNKWIKSGRFNCRDDLLTEYQLSKKKDDMADSLIGGMAYVEWWFNSLSFLNSVPNTVEMMDIPTDNEKKKSKRRATLKV
ncbi:ribonuclease H-like domain-containing protein [Globomyces pollinis-pini]|nr:ribonuclease H-like domain-containing protein [Globomyces pollinis-pini]